MMKWIWKWLPKKCLNCRRWILCGYFCTHSCADYYWYNKRLEYWRTRLKENVIQPTIDKMMDNGILPKADYKVEYPNEDNQCR